MKFNKLNHFDYKCYHGASDPWYCISMSSKIFPFGTLRNKTFSSATANSLIKRTTTTVSNDTNNISIKSS